MDREIAEALKEQGGILSVCELADLLELDEGRVRRWAREHDVRRIGSTFAFSKDTAFALADDLLAADDEGDDDDEDGEYDDIDEEEEADDENEDENDGEDYED